MDPLSKRKFVQPGTQDNRAKNEAALAREEFERVINEEKKRVRSLAQEENERVMKVWREKEGDVRCPLCLEELQAITQLHGYSVMVCCGTRLCRGCADDWQQRQDMQSMPICFACRRPVCVKSLRKLVASGGKKRGNAFGLNFLADYYCSDADYRKGLEYYERAAAFGSAQAQATLATVYLYGELYDLKVRKSTEKAMEMAKQSVSQGYATAYEFLGTYMENEYGIMNEESLRCYSLAAYQGQYMSMFKLGKLYAKRYGREQEKDNNSRPTVEMRKIAILAIYWYGKACEEVVNNGIEEMDGHVIMGFIFSLDRAMRRLWHNSLIHNLDPLTGYSHLPFANSLTKFISKKTPEKEKPDVFMVSFENRTWKTICAQCGKRETEVTMKTCARCKTFSYCSKECQIKHWKAGHKVDCKGHWVERFFPKIRSPGVDYAGGYIRFVCFGL